jgi:hypothetical protein
LYALPILLARCLFLAVVIPTLDEGDVHRFEVGGEGDVHRFEVGGEGDVHQSTRNQILFRSTRGDNQMLGLA